MANFTAPQEIVTLEECELKRQIFEQKLNNIHTDVKGTRVLLEEKIKEIKTNDLVHMDEKIEKIDNRTWWILGSVVILGLAQLVAQVIL